jgi:hypothetical protein
MDNSARIKKAIDYAVRYGGIDGDHHKAWVIDQMVRALTGCPEVQRTARSHGVAYDYLCQGESEEYLELVRSACASDDPDEEAEWDVGIPP